MSSADDHMAVDADILKWAKEKLRQVQDRDVIPIDHSVDRSVLHCEVGECF